MEKKRSVGVTVFGWAIIVTAILGFTKLAEPKYLKFLLTIPIETTVRMLILVLYLVSGIGILKLLNWARKLVIIITSVSLIDLILFGFARVLKFTSSIRMQVIGLIAVTTFCIFYILIFYFFTRPKVKEQFR